MSKKKVKEFEYAKTFDRLMGERFNEEFETEWNLFVGSYGGYATVRTNGKKLTKRMIDYGNGLSDGMAAAQTHYELS